MKYLLSYQNIIFAIVLLMAWGCVIEDVENELQREVPTIEDDFTNNEEEFDLEGVVDCCVSAPRYFNYPSFVEYFIDPDVIYMGYDESVDSILVLGFTLVDTGFRTIRFENFNESERKRKKDKDSLFIVHKHYAELYGDTFFVHGDGRIAGEGGVIQDTVLLIDLVSNTEYDENHPVGTSLANILKIKSVNSLRVYISNGYQLKEDFNREMLLSEFNEQSHLNYLLRFYARLIFTKAPAKTSTHTFTIHYKERSGKHLQYTMDPITIQGRED
jgi:hypothetical protein